MLQRGSRGGMRHGPARDPHALCHPDGFPGRAGSSLLGISPKSRQGFSTAVWLDAGGKPSDYAPCLELSDALAGWGELGARRDWCHLLCRGVGRVSVRPGASLRGAEPPRQPWMHGGREAWEGGPEQSWSSSLPAPSAVAQSSALGSPGQPVPWPLLPGSSSACTYLYGEVPLQERYSGASAVGRGATGCSTAASWL